MLLPCIAPSILSADFACLLDQCNQVIDSGARWLHLDIMDGHFVDNLSFGPALVKSLHKHLKEAHAEHLVFDCHLMVTEPIKWAKRLSPYADSVTLHYEALSSEKIHETILNLKEDLRKNDCKLGLAVKPSTLVSEISSLLALFDLILVMTVEPGHGGQALLPHCLLKITELNKLRRANDMKFLIQVDGGVNDDTIGQIKKVERVDILVAGAAIFGDINPGTAYKKLVDRLIDEK